MKKGLLFLLFFISISAFLMGCKKDAIIKCSETTTYHAKLINGEIIQDTIKSKYRIDRYISGAQKTFIGVLGFSKNDTTFFKEYIVTKKEQNGFTFNYSNNVLTGAYKESHDTTFFFNPYDLKKYSSYQISDNKGVIKEFDAMLYETIEYLSREFDAEGNMTMSVKKIIEEPSSWEQIHLSEIEVAKYKIDHTSYEIEKNKYEYW